MCLVLCQFFLRERTRHVVWWKAMWLVTSLITNNATNVIDIIMVQHSPATYVGLLCGVFCFWSNSHHPVLCGFFPSHSECIFFALVGNIHQFMFTKPWTHDKAHRATYSEIMGISQWENILRHLIIFFLDLFGRLFLLWNLDYKKCMQRYYFNYYQLFSLIADQLCISKCHEKPNKLNENIHFLTKTPPVPYHLLDPH